MSDTKRPRGSSDFDVSPLPDSTKQDNHVPPNKKPRRGEIITTKVHSTDTHDEKVRNAFTLNSAIKRATQSDFALGHSLSVKSGFWLSGNRQELSSEQEDILWVMKEAYKDIPCSYRHGIFEEAFHLTITRAGCEFDGDIVPSSYRGEGRTLLEQWFSSAAISGYGDIKDLETKVDINVRDAREIPAAEFNVEPEFLERIRQEWAKHFIPGEGVRVEPYKIHIYGPGGHFKPHRDTPERGLVGTFLVGIADTTGRFEDGNFCIGDEKLYASPGSWVAFHPDVPHSITKLGNGYYRGVIAFKIFGNFDSAERELVARELEIQLRLAKAFSTIPLPYGVLLGHKYPIGVQRLNGFDAVVLAAAKEREGAVVHVLPVVVGMECEQYYDEAFSDDSEDNKSWFLATIFPITPAHVDYYLASEPDMKAQAREGLKWLEGVSNVPFFSRSFDAVVTLWDKKKEEINFTGNQADGEREDSIYLSYALLILPK